MKAVILAGGRGTRGKPYTDFFPKAMTPINGKPLIEYIVKYLESFEFVDEIIIVADFDGLGGQIKNYLHSRNNIRFIQDTQSGTGGDLLHIEEKLMESKEFVLWFVDNLCAIDLRRMLEYFKEKNLLACIATRSARKEETGFAVVSDSGIIKEFKEKPTLKLPIPECLGIYMLSRDILDVVKKKAASKKEVNLSFDVLEDLSKESKICAFDIGDTEWIDIESPVTLDRNKETIKDIITQMESWNLSHTA